MKGLKYKLFFTLFVIFSAFILTLSLITVIENYNKEYNNILESINNAFRINDRDRFFIDEKVYTVIYDDDNNINLIISHGIEDDTESIKESAVSILSKNKDKNLNYLFNKYSYIKSNNVLVIVDNANSQESMYNIINLVVFLLIIFELISVFISYYISLYLTKPVEEAFNKQKDFIADASHELKTPIAVIMASSDALESNPKETKYLTNIKNETERMSVLVTDLLNLSKIELSNTNYEDVDLSLLMNKEILTFEVLAFENSVSFEDNIEDGIKFKCDIEDIRKLVGILLDNAIKHSYKNEEIIVNLSKNNNDIIITVSNKGDTINSEDIDKIFDRFYKVDKSRNRDSNHYGLGLAIAKSITTKYNGKISVTSNNNVTIFKVIFKI